MTLVERHPEERDMHGARCIHYGAAALGLAVGSWVGAAGAQPAPPEGDGFSVAAGAALWPRWQARVTVGSARDWRAGNLGADGANRSPRGVGVLGDYHFGRSLAPAQAGSFRATSGLLIGTRSLSLATAVDGLKSRGGAYDAPLGTEPAAVPYFGLGYSGASVRSGLSYSADLGLTASGVKLGRGLGGSPNLDDMLRELRLSPVLQLGVSYSF